MSSPAPSFDWSLLQTFLAVAQTGSLSAAARELKLSQPTVGRHIQSLEEQVGAELFLRQAKGMALSDAGQRLLEPAERMREAAEALRLTAQDLKSLGVIDRIISEPVGGAQRGRRQTVATVGKALEAELETLLKHKPQALRDQRRKKFLDMGSKGLAA